MEHLLERNNSEIKTDRENVTCKQRHHLVKLQCNTKICYLVFGLSVNVSERWIGVEGWMRVVPTHHTVTFDPEQLRCLSLRDGVHLTLQTCAQAVTWFCCTDLHKHHHITHQITNKSSCIYCSVLKLKMNHLL